jgi:predicted nucleic acid-binding protein
VIVVDSNVIAYFFIPSEFTEASLRLLEREPRWSVPLLWRSELRNVLAGYMRGRTMSLEEASRIQGAAETLLSQSEFQMDSASVLKLVRDSACSAYDCEYVALAMELDTTLVTMDAKLLRAFPDRARSLV